MISAFFILNIKGEVLISRLFRPDLKRSISDIFRIHVIASSTPPTSPLITLGSTTFFHVRHGPLWLVAVTKNNANAALVFEFAYRFINLGRSYFGKLDEESVKNNFVLIYELLDEILDFGYPQNSESDTLKMYITTEGVKSELAVREEASKITIQATGATSWRRNDVKYRKNEAFVDVVETVNLSMSSSGTVLRADVDGQILMRAYLSGTPECKFGLNDKLVLDRSSQPKGAKNLGAVDSGAVELDDCQFHQCVKLGKFDSDRTISFIPPDGEFELMRYRSTTNINLPFRVQPIVQEVGKSKVEYTVHVKANFNPKLSANNVVIKIPTPLNTTKVDCKVGMGKAKYVPAENVIVWKIPRFQGQTDCTFTAEASLSSTTHRKAWSRPPISIDFQVLMFTASGLLVRFLKVFERSNYQSVKWVRYLTKANGTYLIREGESSENDLPLRRANPRKFVFLGPVGMCSRDDAYIAPLPFRLRLASPPNRDPKRDIFALLPPSVLQNIHCHLIDAPAPWTLNQLHTFHHLRHSSPAVFRSAKEFAHEFWAELIIREMDGFVTLDLSRVIREAGEQDTSRVYRLWLTLRLSPGIRNRRRIARFLMKMLFKVGDIEVFKPPSPRASYAGFNGGLNGNGGLQGGKV
ncbi:AP-2 complex subunit mu-1 [Pseudohyphozyma bogoriensis]|nr:AP-2 complex subunit mu-1 [Pseudohyphozyma bogoriensis]